MYVSICIGFFSVLQSMLVSFTLIIKPFDAAANWLPYTTDLETIVRPPTAIAMPCQPMIASQREEQWAIGSPSLPIDFGI